MSHNIHKLDISALQYLICLETKVHTCMTARTTKGYAGAQNRVAWTHGLNTQITGIKIGHSS